MSKYGTSDYQLAKYLDRQEIEHALMGEIRTAETKDGNFVYEKATKEECDKVIMENFDAVVFEAIGAFRDGRVIEQTFGYKKPISTKKMEEYRGHLDEQLKVDEQGIYYTEVFNVR